jgi:hypothetical protein
LKWYCFAVPILCYSLWQTFLFWRWGAFPNAYNRDALGLPFAGVVGFLRDTLAFTTSLQVLWFAETCFIIGFAVLVIASLSSSATPAYEKIAWLLYAALGALLTRKIWLEDWAFMRALSEYFVLGALIVIGSRMKVRVPLLACTTAVWLLVFVRLCFP